MIPATGWLPQDRNQLANPSGKTLPEPFVGRYFEGGDGVILGATELDFREVTLLFVKSFIRERFGYGRSSFSDAFVAILNIDLTQNDVFGVILVDSFNPPALAAEFFEFPAYTQGACEGCIEPTHVVPVVPADDVPVVIEEDDPADIVLGEIFSSTVPFSEA